MRILIVEDDELVADLLREMLENEPADIDHADSCREAKLLLQKNRYDWIVLDYHLGDGTGLQVLEHLRQLGHPSRALFLTGAVITAEMHAQADRLGADAILEKPLFLFTDDLRRKIHSLADPTGDVAPTNCRTQAD